MADRKFDIIYNHHSYFHDTVNVMPPYLDLEFEKFNARYYRPLFKRR